MKKFIIHGELVKHIGQSVDLNCYSVRSFFEHCFGNFPSFRQYFINKIYNGANFIFVDKNGDTLDAYCSDLILKESVYNVFPKLEGQAGGPIMGFAMNALMGYGMQKLANALNPVESSGEEYEIISTNSWLYSSNENRSEQGTAIPIVYGQLRIGSLVINSNIMNLEFDHDSATILRPPNLSYNIFTQAGYNNVSFDFTRGTHLLSENSLSSNSLNDKEINGYIDYNDSSKRSRLQQNQVGPKSFSPGLGNDSYNSNYSASSSQGGDRLILGPSQNRTSNYSASASYLDNGSNNEAFKPWVFPREGDIDFELRPNKKSDYCFTLIDQNNSKNNITKSKVGNRGNYTKLESIALYRSLDILSEGPIAGLALPIKSNPTYNTTDKSFQNDHGNISLGYSANSFVYVSSDNSATFNNVSFSQKHGTLLDTSQINADDPTYEITIKNGGKNYKPAGINGYSITVNAAPDANDLSVEIALPDFIEEANISDSFINSESNPDLVKTTKHKAVFSPDKFYTLIFHKSQPSKNLAIIENYYKNRMLPISRSLNSIIQKAQSNNGTIKDSNCAILWHTQSTNEYKMLEMPFRITTPLMKKIPDLGILSLNLFKNDVSTTDDWYDSQLGISKAFIINPSPSSGCNHYQYVPTFNLEDLYFMTDNNLLGEDDFFGNWDSNNQLSIRDENSWAMLLNILHDTPYEGVQFNLESMQKSPIFEKFLELGNSLNSTLEDDLDIHISPQNSAVNLDVTFRMQESGTSEDRDRSSTAYCSDLGLAISSNMHEDPGSAGYVSDTPQEIIESLKDNSRFKSNTLKGMLRPYAYIKNPVEGQGDLDLDNTADSEGKLLFDKSITLILHTGPEMWRASSEANPTDFREFQTSEFSGFYDSESGSFSSVTFCTLRKTFWDTNARYKYVQKFREFTYIDITLKDLLFQKEVTIKTSRVYDSKFELSIAPWASGNETCMSEGASSLGLDSGQLDSFEDSFGSTITIENQFNRDRSWFSNTYKYMIDYPQDGFSDGDENIGQYHKINVFGIISGSANFTYTNSSGSKTTVEPKDVGYGNNALPISIMLRNSLFADDFIDKAEELIQNHHANYQNFEFVRFYATKTIDASGDSHQPRQIKIIPGVGSTKRNDLDAPFYLFNKVNAWKLDDLNIIKDGTAKLEESIIDDEIIEFLDIDPIDFYQKYSDKFSRGYYNDSLLYRAEIYTLRVRNLGVGDVTINEYCLTNIDCFCEISSLGRVNKVYITDVPDNPVWDKEANSGKGMWTPIHPYNFQYPAPINYENSPGNNVKINSTSYQDLGLILKIDSSNSHQEVGLTFNGQGNISKVINSNNYDTYSDYIKDVKRPNLTMPNMTHKVAHGIIANSMDNNTPCFAMRVTKDIIPSSIQIKDPTKNAEIFFNLEKITLKTDGMYTTSIDAFAVKDNNFYTGRLTSTKKFTPGAGYYTKKGDTIFSQPKVKVYNRLMGVQTIQVSSSGFNSGYQPNSIFYIYGSIAKTSISSDQLRLTPPKFNNENDLLNWWENNSNLSNSSRNMSGEYSALELSNFKAAVFIGEDGSISQVKVIDPGYQLGSFNDLIYNEDDWSLCINLIIPEAEHHCLIGMYRQDTGKTYRLLPDLEYTSGFSSKSKYRINSQFSALHVNGSNAYYSPLFKESAPNNQSECLWPGSNMIKQDLILRIRTSFLGGGDFGKLSKIEMLRPGMGFSDNFDINNILSSLSPDTSDLDFKLLVDIDSNGTITKLRFDPNNPPRGYGVEDKNLEVLFASNISQTSTKPTDSSSDLDEYSWAYSIFLNDTPIRDKNGRFNFSKFDYNLSCGLFKNLTTKHALDNDIFNHSPPEIKNNLLKEEFRLPTQTKVINYPLYGPRNNGERDYYYTHTVSNPEISMVSLSFKINELHYIYEGDEELVTLNLMPIVGAILGYLGTQKLIEMLGGLAPDPQIQTNAGNTGPACVTAVTGGIGVGANVPSLSHASKVLVMGEIAKELLEFGLSLIGSVLGFAIAKLVPCPSFLCFKVGSLIKNSGEIWPAKIMFKIEYGLEGEDDWKYDIFTASGCATSPFIKDVYLKDFPQLNHKQDPANIKKRIIKVYRITREMDPVNFGIIEARFKMDAELFSVSEHVGGYFSYPNTALFAMRTNSKDMPDIPKREFIIKGKMVNVPSFYSPSTGTYGIQPTDADKIMAEDLQWTSNPAWVIYDLLINPIYGLGKYGITEDDIDIFSFIRFSKLSDEAVDAKFEGSSYKERRFMCNLYIDQQKPAYDYIKSLLNIYNSTLNFSGGKIYISDDLPKDPIMIFNNSNITESGFNYSSTPKSERLTACTVDYLDERNEYKMTSEYFEDAKNISEIGYIHARIAGISITRRGEALRLAKSKVLTSQMQKEIIQFETGLPASYLKIGDVINVLDNNKLPKQSSGKILSINSARTSIEIDIPVSALPDIKSISIQSVINEGEMDDDRSPQFKTYNVSSFGSNFTINLSSAIDSNIKTGFTWMVSEFKNNNQDDNDKIKQYQIKNLKEINSLTFEVIAIEFDPDKFDLLES